MFGAGAGRSSQHPSVAVQAGQRALAEPRDRRNVAIRFARHTLNGRIAVVGKLHSSCVGLIATTHRAECSSDKMFREEACECGSAWRLGLVSGDGDAARLDAKATPGSFASARVRSTATKRRSRVKAACSG